LKKRAITGIIFAVVLILMLVIKNNVLDSIIICGISLGCLFEYSKAFKKAGYHPISWVGIVASLALFLLGNTFSWYTKLTFIKIALPIFIIAILMNIIITNQKRNIVDVAISILAILYIPLMLCFFKLVLLIENGRYYACFILLGAYSSDIYAYLIGSKFGKHKLTNISPNKTVEGSIAGIIGVVISYIILSIIIEYKLNININLFVISIMGSVVRNNGSMR